MHEKDHHEPGTAPRTDRATPSRGPRGHRRLPGAQKGRGRPHALPDRPGYSAGYSGRQRRADPDPTASSWSELGHDEHFLQRVLRCEGIDLERAMRLYHHSVVMRRIVPELMKALPPHHERAAIPLRKTTPSPHVVVTRKGAFVTCLSAPMGVGRLPVLPVAPIDEEIRRADLEQERLRRLPALFAALPLKKLVRALYQGPGALTREMVQIIEKDVWAFEPLLIRVFIHFLRQFCGNERDRKRLGYRRWLEIERVKIDTQIRQGLLLLGLVDSADLAQRFEPRLFELFTSTMAEAAALMARKPGRAKVLLELVKNREGASNWVRGGATDALLLHCVWFPEEAKWALPALLELEPPRRYTAWYAVLIPNEAAARKDTAATVRSFLGHFGPGSKLQPLEYPEKAPYACTMRQLILHACHRTPVSQHFPPASEAAQQARGFAEYLRARPERDPALKPGKPVVLEAPRVGRNQPCPCGSGEKFKRCCLGKPAAPASTAAAAANPPAAEHSSAKEPAP